MPAAAAEVSEVDPLLGAISVLAGLARADVPKGKRRAEVLEDLRAMRSPIAQLRGTSSYSLVAEELLVQVLVRWT